jgi:hypothetical protein
VAAAAGNLYVSDSQLSVVRKITSAGAETVIAGNGTYGYSGDGGPATSAALYDPESVAVDGAGNVVIADSAGTPLWAPTGLLVPGAELTSGQSITTPGGAFRLTMQGDGNLVLYGASNSALWASGTSGNPGAYLVLGDDGNLVVDSAAGTVLWTEP